MPKNDEIEGLKDFISSDAKALHELYPEPLGQQTMKKSRDIRNYMKRATPEQRRALLTRPGVKVGDMVDLMREGE